MSNEKKIIKVHLHKSFNGKNDYYFSNLSKIYSILSSSLLGICKQALINYKFYDKEFYANSFCTIETITLY